MRLAIVCSWLNQYGGAERVLEVMHDMYPDAPIYTSIYWPDALPERYQQWDIRPSFLNRWPLIKRHHQPFLPFYPYAFEYLDLEAYDVVISLTSAFAHGILTTPDTLHICYCLTPARFLWDYASYVQREQLGRLTRWLLPLFITRLRLWDRVAADRVDQFVGISQTIQARIAKYYGRDAALIYPPVEIPKTVPSGKADDYFLSVGRLVPYKRVDLLVKAFNQLGLPLHVVGDGRDRAALEAIAAPNITFLGRISDVELQREYARCRAFIFPGKEDFGITPVEAQAAGRPVIAYAAGGALDTVIPGQTGAFFEEQTVKALIKVVSRFDASRYDPDQVHANALRFSRVRFQEVFSDYVETAASKHIAARKELWHGA